MRFDDEGLVHYNNEDIRDFACGTIMAASRTTQAAKEWVDRQWTPPKIGDRFTTNGVGNVYMLCHVDNQCVLIEHTDGRNWRSPVAIKSVRNITKQEWDGIAGTTYTFTPLDKT